MHGRAARAVAIAAAAALGLAPAAFAQPRPAPTVDVANADRCDFLVPEQCLLPFPSDRFTVEDDTTDTGRRIALSPDSMPVAKPVEIIPGFKTPGGVFDPTDLNRNDGFSPGAQIIVKVPGLDNPTALANTNPVGLRDLSRYTAADAPVVVINARTRKRHPIWVELDSHASTDAQRALLILPARNFEEGERYIVALRHLRDAGGQVIGARDAFRIYRDKLQSKQPAVQARRGQMESMLQKLRQAGIARESLYLAWDFTVASERSISERILTMRDDAFASLGDTDLRDLKVRGSAPAYQVTSSEEFTEAQDPLIRRRIRGRFTVPCYLTPDCGPPQPLTPGKRFNDPDGDGIPERNAGQDFQAEFRCDLPRRAGKLRPSLYGHGLLGSQDEMNQGQLKALAHDHGFVFCATKWIGISNEDVPYTATAVTNWANFPAAAARMQQGMLNFLFLGRLMIHPDGFSQDPLFRQDGQSVIDTRRLFYDGNSQGGIMGGALAAVAPDHQRAVLGVPGMNYSVLLPRSVDFDLLRQLNDAAYDQVLQRPVIYSLVQMMWDRAEANGYAHHMTSDPLPNTPTHKILLHVAYGDHQVSQYTADVEARTIGARVRRPAVYPGRTDNEPGQLLPSIPSYPYDGSALVYWDAGPFTSANPLGTPPPPVENLPPRIGQDPHEFPRRTPEARQMKSDFLRIGGSVTNTCGAGPCYSNGFTGP